MRWVIAAVSAGVLALGLSPVAQAATPPSSGASDPCIQWPGTPSPGTAAWETRDLTNIVCATQRQQDELSNPAFLRLWAIQSAEDDPGALTTAIAQQVAQPTRPVANPVHFAPGVTITDPFRDPRLWQEEGRGQQQTLTFVATDGAHLYARLYWPNGRGPYPGVVMIPGLQAYNEVYDWIGEGLAEAGYMVLIPDPQGQGGSESLPHNPDGSIACGATGCAQTSLNPTSDQTQIVTMTSAVDFLVSTRAHPDPDAKGANAEGALTYNPEWRLLDPLHIGVAGHSNGARAVTSQGQDDPRVKAVVSMDNLDDSITLAKGATIHAPTLYFGVDYAFPSVPEPMSPSDLPNPEQHALYAYAQTRAAGVDTMLIVPRASTHYEFDYEPFPATLQASRYGERVAMYYIRAWFDRYLKGESSATRRLTALTFDGSADASSIGAGTFDAAAAAADPTDPAAGNVPYKIGGLCVADLLSFSFHSDFSLDGGRLSRVDMQSRGCPAVPLAPR